MVYLFSKMLAKLAKRSQSWKLFRQYWCPIGVMGKNIIYLYVKHSWNYSDSLIQQDLLVLFKQLFESISMFLLT